MKRTAADALVLRQLRELHLAQAPAPGRAAHLAAASGLVLTGGRFHVVADDELHLGVFSTDREKPGILVRTFPGELPPGRKARKRAKPDGEALVALPAFARYPHGALLALGSGSRPNRCRAALLALDQKGAIAGAARTLDLSALYDALAIDHLNIEGACVAGAELHLLQRGGRKGPNLRVRLELPAVLAAMAQERLPPLRPRAIDVFDLGQIEGVPLGFTDAASLPAGRMLFTAVAEDRDDSYHDGPCGAAAVGIAGPDGTIEFLGLLRPAWKVEGVVAWIHRGAVHLRLVTDADDASRPAVLLAGELPWGG